MKALLPSNKKRSRLWAIGGASARVVQGPRRNHLFSASGGNDAAAKEALTNDYPEEVNCAADSFASPATWFSSQAAQCGLTKSPGRCTMPVSR